MTVFTDRQIVEISSICISIVENYEIVGDYMDPDETRMAICASSIVMEMDPTIGVLPPTWTPDAIQGAFIDAVVSTGMEVYRDMLEEEGHDMGTRVDLQDKIELYASIRRSMLRLVS